MYEMLTIFLLSKWILQGTKCGAMFYSKYIHISQTLENIYNPTNTGQKKYIIQQITEGFFFLN